MDNKIIAGLDIGTTKTCAVIAERGNNNIRILGYGVVPSAGLHRGTVVNIGKTAASITEAIDIAMKRANVEVESVNVGVAGEHIKTQYYKNYITIRNEEEEVRESDVNQLLEDVENAKIPPGHKIIHIIPDE